MQFVCQSAHNCHVSLGPALFLPALIVRLSEYVEIVNRQPLCLVSSGETVKPFPLTDVPDMLSTRRCNRFIRRCRRLVVIGFHSASTRFNRRHRRLVVIGLHLEIVLPHSSPHRSGYQHSIVVLVALS